MHSLRQRVIEPELLDTLDPEAARGSLADLTRINRDFGGHSALRGLLNLATGPDETFSLLDVGAASGDMGRRAVEWRPNARVTCLDRMESHLAAADAPKTAGDAFCLPFRDGAFDFVFSSLFLHHFTNGRVVELLREFRRVARKAVMAIDLERHPFAYYFLPATRWLYGWDAVTVHDGIRSVAAGFSASEIGELAKAAGLQPHAVETHGLAYRVTLLGWVNGHGGGR
jgi:2-polyprenyl-3-methyl-5-hydroxy-6-metoxy-1,4-benzoquinol methylase